MSEKKKEERKKSFDLFGGWKKEKQTDAGNAPPLQHSTKQILQRTISGKTPEGAKKEKKKNKDNEKTKTKNFRPEPDRTLQSARKAAPASSSPAGWGQFVTTLGAFVTNKDDETSAEALIESARSFMAAGELNQNNEKQKEKALKKFEKEMKVIFKQMESNFGNIGLEKFNPLSFLYYIEYEESRKTPSWKRRHHRFMPSIEIETVYALHDALYLAQLSYVDSVEEIQIGLEHYRNYPWEMIFCTVEGKPREPAHFIALKKEEPEEKKKNAGKFPWSDSFLEVLIVVRGTKEIGDMMSDAMLEAGEYHGGKAHDGVMKAGLFLVEKHKELLEHLLKESGRKKLKISLVGHSLGAGAASIACLEFNDHPQMEATCIGFGCPALLSKENAVKCQDTITTIISDSDCIPRMSGATLANMLLDMMSYDWTPKALEDLDLLLHVLNCNVPFDVSQEKRDEAKKFVERLLKEKVLPNIESVQKERIEVELFPPGKCIHFFRDGVGISASYMDCDFFNEIEVTRTMVDDHLVPTGYNRVFTELMRTKLQNTKFDFRHDVLALRQKKPEEDEEEADDPKQED